MSEEILINVTPRETRVALVENGMLQEVHIERASRRGYVGNIYKGKVSRVMPGMQAAFVEIGLDRAAFLHASDIVRPSIRRCRAKTAKGCRRRLRRSTNCCAMARISSSRWSRIRSAPRARA